MTTPDATQQRLIQQLKQAYSALEKMEARLEQADAYRSEAIAVVGAACRFPGGADSPQAFWELLQRGDDVIAEVPATRWDNEALYDPDPDAPGRVATRFGGFLERVDGFDARFFSVTPREAAALDPQHRLLLEICWEALEDAGLPPAQLVGSKTGVFTGLSTFDYAAMQFARGTFEQIDPYLITGSFPCMAAGRIAYTLGLNGPTLTVDTACSSSLVAVHLACRALRSRECDSALACGANLMLTPEVTINFSKAHMLSPDGRCKSFDASANGYVRGEGAAGLVLKRLSDAEAAGDRIYAVLRGSAVNHDGVSAGITVPNGKAQQAVIRAALADARTDAEAVAYVETHGTGTPLGDPLEAEALGAVFAGERSQPLLLGAVKTNLGHTEAAAGLAGLLKTILSVQHGAIPATLHYHTPNPKIPWSRLPLEIVDSSRAWPEPATNRIAGVSSFGASGTNAHVVVAGYEPAPAAPIEAQRPYLVRLSAKDEAALQAAAQRLEGYLEQQPHTALDDLCHTLAAGRTHFEQRLAVVAANGPDLRAGLAAFQGGEHHGGLLAGTRESRPRAALLFTGQGSQYVGMGRELYQREPVFRATFDQCAEILAPLLPHPLHHIVFAASESDPRIHQTQFTQPALFALAVALYRTLASHGLAASALLGHSVGEIAAAHLAGVFSLEDGLTLIAARARLMGGLPAGGAMASVFADGDTVAEALAPYGERVAIAAYNGPALTMISGPAADVNTVCRELGTRDIRCMPLTVSHAFHSPLMDPMLDAFADAIAGLRFHPPQRPLIAGLTGDFAGDDIATVDYWVKHVRQPVQFQRGMQTLAQKEPSLFVEIGAKPSLCGMARRCLPDIAADRWVATLRPDAPDETFHKALARLYTAGFDPAAQRRPGARLLSLPTYPFQRKSYWVNLAQQRSSNSATAARFTMTGAPLALAGEHEKRFERNVTAGEPAFLADHVIHGSVIMPASAYVDTALCAAREVFDSDQVALDSLQIGLPLQFHGAETRCMQVVITARDTDHAGLEIYSRALQGDPAWLRHAEATIVRRAAVGTPATLEQARAACRKNFDPAELYRFYRTIGLELGPHFTAVKALQLGDGQALGRIEPLEDDAATSLHPAALDACFQVVGPLFLHLMHDHNYLPVAIDGVQLLGPGQGPLWCYGRLAEALPAEGLPETLRADFTLYDDGGRPVALVHGLRFRKTTRAAILRGLAAGRHNPLLRVAYEPIQLTPNPTAGAWLICADRYGLGDQLADLIRAQDQNAVVTLVRTGTRDELGDDGFTFDPFQAQRLESFDHALRDAGPFNIVYLWALDVDDHEHSHLAGLLHLTQSMVKQGVKGRTLLVTRGAVAVDDLAGANPNQHALWGFGATLQLEHAELGPRLLDLDPATTPNAADLLSAIHAQSGETRLVRRGDQWLGQRLQPLEADTADQPAPIRADAAYLISGGFGALGLKTAAWLAEQGARELILLGRREPSRQAQQQLDRLRDSGVRVQPLTADIANADDVARVFRDAAEILSPIKGVFHCAGVLDDAVLTHSEWPQFQRVLAPKIAGAWNLHQQGGDLEWFVTYSSVAAVLGSVGQAHYAAANAYLDALAQHRRALGLPALSLNWGPWAGAGMAATAQARVQEGWRRMGLNLLPAAQAFTTLQRLAATPLSNAIVVEIAWPQYLDKRYRGAPPALFQHLRPKTTAAKRPAQSKRAQLAAAQAEQRAELVADHVRACIAAIMSLDSPDELEPRQPLFDFGLDSLMAVEVRNQLEADFEIELGATLLFDYPTVEALVRHLVDDQLPAELFARLDAAPAAQPVRHQSFGAELEDIPADIDDRQVVALLLAELQAIEEENHD